VPREDLSSREDEFRKVRGFPHRPWDRQRDQQLAGSLCSPSPRDEANEHPLERAEGRKLFAHRGRHFETQQQIED